MIENENLGYTHSSQPPLQSGLLPPQSLGLLSAWVTVLARARLNQAIRHCFCSSLLQPFGVILAGILGLGLALLGVLGVVSLILTIAKTERVVVSNRTGVDR